MIFGFFPRTRPGFILIKETPQYFQKLPTIVSSALAPWPLIITPSRFIFL